MKIKILILFSGIGGATLGYRQAFPNAEIVTIDIEKKYSPTHVGDALGFPLEFYRQFDLLHGSPPCHHYSTSSCSRGRDYPDLLDQTIKLFEKVGKPYIVENVNGAKSKIRPHDIILRGQNFPDLRDIRRPRKFWIKGFTLPPVQKYPKIFPYFRLISGGGGWIREPAKVKRMSIKEVLRRWNLPDGFEMKDYAQIIPPQYTKWLGEAFKAALSSPKQQTLQIK